MDFTNKLTTNNSVSISVENSLPRIKGYCKDCIHYDKYGEKADRMIYCFKHHTTMLQNNYCFDFEPKENINGKRKNV